ncbi:hypothetical protein GCM10010145_47550 [Streptomyces ruber]|uniref:Uncharacterized protein n=2 Tax=Streptomyces TaxID=1883 RepID=A0A918EU04_9ACTN|nr:hypothetical protein GCM10010145_47550 [Streptomyces ruber]
MCLCRGAADSAHPLGMADCPSHPPAHAPHSERVGRVGNALCEEFPAAPQRCGRGGRTGSKRRERMAMMPAKTFRRGFSQVIDPIPGNALAIFGSTQDAEAYHTVGPVSAMGVTSVTPGE